MDWGSYCSPHRSVSGLTELLAGNDFEAVSHERDENARKVKTVPGNLFTYKNAEHS